jgi:flotillin
MLRHATKQLSHISHVSHISHISHMPILTRTQKRTDSTYFGNLIANSYADDMTSITSNFVEYCVYGLIASSAVAGLGALAAQRVHVAKSSEFIVKTGIFVDDIDVSKKTFRFPFQRIGFIDMTPHTITINVEAMTQEMMPFSLPVSLTYGPLNDTESLVKYARLMAASDDIMSLVRGICHGTVRISASNLTLEQLFASRDKFKAEITDSVNKELQKFGTTVFNVNVEELKDCDGSKYFENMRRRIIAQSEAVARIATAEKLKDAEVGEKTNSGEARQEIARIEQEAKLVENARDRDVLKSTTDLNLSKVEFGKQVEMAKLEADAIVNKRNFELQKTVEAMRNEQEVERLRATNLSQICVEAEIKIRAAEGTRNAAIIEADGNAQAKKLIADAELYSEQARANSILALRQAEAEGLQKLVQASGDINGLAQYMMVRDGVLQQLAKENSNALQGLQPKINVWNTNSGENSNSSFSDTVSNMMRTMIPLASNIKDQTGIDLLHIIKSNNNSKNEESK